MSNPSYWGRKVTDRRKLLRGMAAGTGGIAALSLVGCGSGKSSESSKVPEQPNTGKAIDSEKGIPGGQFVWQSQGWGTTLAMVQNSSATASGFAHAGLLEIRGARPIGDPYATDLDPELAQAMPEQPDEQTYVFKLRDARFHNGRTVTSEDVRYSLDRYANWQNSSLKANFAFIDRVETPDPKTAIIKTKAPFADALVQLSSYQTFILAKEFEEGPDALNKIMGAGPFIFEEVQQPVTMRFKKNPDFFQKPYPYFDSVLLLGAQDDAARIASFISGQVSLTWGQVPPGNRQQMERGRPDAVKWPLNYASHSNHYRVDRPPFNDKRLRQALSMSVDRKQIRETYSGGDGEDDQVLSWIIGGWGFRKPKDLPSAKYWVYDVAEAKKLAAATGISLPVKANLYLADQNFLGQGYVDHAILASAKWREAGIADFSLVTQPIGQFQAGANVGNYEGAAQGPSAIANAPLFGPNIKSYFWSPPGGLTAPTLNNSFVNNPELNPLLDKQLTQLKKEERQQTLRRVEEILGEEQYWTAYSTYPSIAYSDPKLRNIQIPKFWFGGMHASSRYWWFEK